MTRRLYFDDPYQTEFEAGVVARFEHDGSPAVVLDQTCFYPTAGGQQCDRGFLNEVPVADVFVQDEDIVHVLGEEMNEPQIRGRIDWPRRFDFMQQHTGQHILSQSFFRVLGAETVSSHLGEDISTLEIRRDGLDSDEAHAVEDSANMILYENREVRTYFVTKDELHTIPFRRPPPPKERIRVIEVVGFDHAACGGTHCRRTGEIGIIKIGRWEKIRNHIRLDFLCGGRALREYRWKSETVERLADLHSAQGRDVLDLVTKQAEESKVLRRELKDLTGRCLAIEGRELLSTAEMHNGIKVVRAVFDSRSAEEIRVLAVKMVEAEKSVVLCGSRGENALLVFACSPGVPMKMNDLMKIGCDIIGGKGGGSAELALGGGPRADRVDEAVEAVYKQVSRGMSLPLDSLY